MLKDIFSYASRDYPGVSLRAIKHKVLRILYSLIYWNELSDVYKRINQLKISSRLLQDSRIMGLLERPYLNNQWRADRRMDVVVSHYEFLESIDSALTAFDYTDSLRLVDLVPIDASLALIIDRSPWFLHEGELVINLFQGSLRVSSLAFTIGKDNSGTVCIFIGALQGIHKGVSSEKSLSIYRDLTKQLYGLRPKSLLVDVLRMIASQYGIKRILGVADENRQHRHPYFGKRDKTTFAFDYNNLWRDVGGNPENEVGFYDIPIKYASRDLSEIPSKKRAMYRHRYETLSFINDSLVEVLSGKLNIQA
jgi:uncharacterized protein VirK/YbjX